MNYNIIASEHIKSQSMNSVPVKELCQEKLFALNSFHKGSLIQTKRSYEKPCLDFREQNYTKHVATHWLTEDGAEL